MMESRIEVRKIWHSSTLLLLFGAIAILIADVSVGTLSDVLNYIGRASFFVAIGFSLNREKTKLQIGYKAYKKFIKWSICLWTFAYLFFNLRSWEGTNETFIYGLWQRLFMLSTGNELLEGHFWMCRATLLGVVFMWVGRQTFIQGIEFFEKRPTPILVDTLLILFTIALTIWSAFTMAPWPSYAETTAWVWLAIGNSFSQESWGGYIRKRILKKENDDITLAEESMLYHQMLHYTCLILAFGRLAVLPFLSILTTHEELSHILKNGTYSKFFESHLGYAVIAFILSLLLPIAICKGWEYICKRYSLKNDMPTWRRIFALRYKIYAFLRKFVHILKSITIFAFKKLVHIMKRMLNAIKAILDASKVNEE